MICLAIITVYLAAGVVLAVCMRDSDRRHQLDASRHASKYIGVVLLWPFAAIMFVGTSLFDSMDWFMEPRGLRHTPESMTTRSRRSERANKRDQA